MANYPLMSQRSEIEAVAPASVEPLPTQSVVCKPAHWHNWETFNIEESQTRLRPSEVKSEF